MKITKRIFTILLCVVICFSMCIISYAANDTAKITVSSADAYPGDTVTIDITIENNPGIMGMAFCVTYNNEAVEYVSHQGGYISSFTYKNHSDKGHISFTNVENKDKTDNGKLLSVTFKVKESAKPGAHTVTLANSNREKYGTKLHNSFSNSKQEFVVPVVKSGAINVAETCGNAGHKWGEWNIISENTCNDDGLKNHVCLRCDYTEEVKIPAAHSFEAEWTVDKAATPEEDGIMSRHCTACDAKTDKFTFSYEEIGGDEEETPDDNSSNESSSQESKTPSSDTEDTSSSVSSDDATTNKPNIDNVVGEKVPQQEAEKFEEYKPPKTEDETSSESVSSNVTSSEVTSSTNTPDDSTTTGTVGNTDGQENPTFFDTPTGIAMIVLSIVLSVGIIVLGVILIIRKQKS